MKALVLDFDGVVSDSAPESFVVALRTYTRLRPACGLSELTRDLEGADLVRVKATPLYHAFVSLLPLGNRAEDFAVALWLLDNHVRVEDQPAYDLQYRAQPPEFLAEFHRLFYQQRRLLCDRDRAAWQALLGPYPDFISVLERRSGEVALALATAKDGHSVRLLLDSYGIGHLFPAERILDKEAGPNKCSHLELLSERLGIGFPDITFVDDKVNHLQSVSGLGVRCALAAWGYNGPREHEIALGQGYLVCLLGDVEGLLFRAT